MLSVELVLPYVAVIVAVWLVEIVPAVAVKVAVVAPAGTLTDPGTDSRLSELESEMVVVPVATATLRSTVQVLVPPEASVVGSQVTDDNRGAAKTGIVTILLKKVPCAMVNCAWGLVVCDADSCR
jgi:hypothetical protein